MDITTLRTLFMNMHIFQGRERDVARSLDHVRLASQGQNLEKEIINRYGDLENLKQPFFVIMDEYHFPKMARTEIRHALKKVLAVLQCCNLDQFLMAVVTDGCLAYEEAMLYAEQKGYPVLYEIVHLRNKITIKYRHSDVAYTALYKRTYAAVNDWKQEFPTIEEINPPENVRGVHIQELKQIQNVVRRKLALNGIPFSLGHVNSYKLERFGESLNANMQQLFVMTNAFCAEIMSESFPAITVFTWMLGTMVSLTDPRD